MTKPFSASSNNNKGPILLVLERLLADARHVLELGSGTGQHAVHFGAALPHLQWQTSDVAANHPGIIAWQEDAHLDNVLAPLVLDVNQSPWPEVMVDAVYTANTAHIMDWQSVVSMFGGVATLLTAAGQREGHHGQFLIYGPFLYGGEHTSDGNVAFDEQLRGGGRGMGIRDVDDLNSLAASVGLRLADDLTMPVNNRLLRFVPAAAGGPNA